MVCQTMPNEASYYRARYYDPNFGRFIGEDPTGFNVRINFYEYAWNSPNDFFDPLGSNPLRDFLCKHLKLPQVPKYPAFESPGDTKIAVDNIRTKDL